MISFLIHVFTFLIVGVKHEFAFGSYYLVIYKEFKFYALTVALSMKIVIPPAFMPRGI